MCERAGFDKLLDAEGRSYCATDMTCAVCGRRSRNECVLKKIATTFRILLREIRVHCKAPRKIFPGNPTARTRLSCSPIAAPTALRYNYRGADGPFARQLPERLSHGPIAPPPALMLPDCRSSVPMIFKTKSYVEFLWALNCDMKSFVVA